MTREQMQKHGDVIKWFIDNLDKGVWIKLISNRWNFLADPSFDVSYKYVQNDEYAELRKALADGKKIQFKTIYDNGEFIWHNMTGLKPTGVFELEAERYRIKTDEPELKVGDWIIYYDNSDKKNIYQIDKIYMSVNRDQLLYFNDRCVMFNPENTELWKPKKGELCVFWNNDMQEYFIAKYNSCNNYARGGLYNEEYWDNVAPLEYIKILKNKR